MKHIIALSLFVCVSFISTQLCMAQSFENQSVAIASAFNSRNAAALSEHFCSKIDLVLPNVDNSYAKTQAKTLLSEFFAKVQPVSFEILHQGTRANASFIIGQLVTSNAKYRVNMAFSKYGNTQLICQLRIELNND
jgi:hypothetical protein